MAYKIIVTPPAERRLERYISYTVFVLKNEQGARNIKEDVKETRKKLSICAGAIALCTDEILAKYGYRKFSFLKHDFCMLYRIDGNTVIVEGMFHESQDYESIFKREMRLK